MITTFRDLKHAVEELEARGVHPSTDVFACERSPVRIEYKHGYVAIEPLFLGPLGELLGETAPDAEEKDDDGSQ